MNKKVNDDSNVYISWGKVFKAPTVDQLYYEGLNYMPVGNPNLSPEKGEVWTLGYNTSINSKTNLSTSVYYCDIDDAITTNENNSLYINANKEKRRGAEISINHEFDEHLSGYASYSYMQIKQDKGNGFERETKEKPNTYRAGLKYKNADWTYTADLTAVSGQKTRMHNLAMGTFNGYTDSNYFVLDLGAQYQVRNNLKIFANVYNLTNARYQEVGGGYSNTDYYKALAGEAYYPMPSRSFIIGVEYTF